MDEREKRVFSALLRPQICLPFCFAALLLVAFLWYPPFWQAGYAPIDPAPFFTEAVQGVDVNHATEQELAVLPGIGPSKARAIIEYRQEHGPFTTASELLEVSGIGPKTLEDIMEFIVIVP
ncbi:helix-hairpin-helix domain-containing protein [Ruminococcaceae bacterium OttesenSCG-928-I18]|nr:helix-hairpin-helix domain-containing protein [Ruminococcaceae bacterium OttesenSCG-928-I18]